MWPFLSGWRREENKVSCHWHHWIKQHKSELNLSGLCQYVCSLVCAAMAICMAVPFMSRHKRNGTTSSVLSKKWNIQRQNSPFLLWLLPLLFPLYQMYLPCPPLLLFQLCQCTTGVCPFSTGRKKEQKNIAVSGSFGNSKHKNNKLTRDYDSIVFCFPCLSPHHVFVCDYS